MTDTLNEIPHEVLVGWDGLTWVYFPQELELIPVAENWERLWLDLGGEA